MWVVYKGESMFDVQIQGVTEEVKESGTRGMVRGAIEGGRDVMHERRQGNGNRRSPARQRGRR